MTIVNLASSIVLTMVMADLAPFTTNEPALGLLEADRRAAREVVKSLELADRELQSGDLKQALNHAKAADALARRILFPEDPDRTRAAITLARIQYRAAGKSRDSLSARKWAGEAYQASLEARNYRSAVRWAEIADTLARQNFPVDDLEWVRASVRLTLARIAEKREAKNQLEARVLTESAIKDAEKSLPPGDPDRARALLSLAEITYAEGNAVAATSLFERVLAESREGKKVDVRSRVQALSALVLIGNGKPREQADDRAASLLVEADGLADPCNPLAIVASQIVAAKVWTQLLQAAERDAATGNNQDTSYKEASTKLASEIDRFQKSLVKAHADRSTAARGLLFLAKFQFDRRQIGESEKTLDLLDQSGGVGEAPLFAGDYWNLQGLLATERSEFATARDFHDRAFGFYFRARLPQQAVALNNLGRLLLRQGDYETAETLFRAVDDYYSQVPELEGGSQRGYALTNLAQCLEWGNNFPEAFKRHRAALEIAKKANPPNPYLVYVCLNNLGINRYTAGEFDAAETFYKESRIVANAAFGPKHFHVAELDVNLAWLAIAREKPEEAERLFSTSLGVFRDLGEDHPRVAEVLSYRARVRHQLGIKEKARDDLNEALTLQERTLARTLRTALSERDRLAVVQEHRVHPESSAWPGVLDTFLDMAAVLGIDTEAQYRRLLTWKNIVARHASLRGDQLEVDPEIRRISLDREVRLRNLRNAMRARLGGGNAVPSRDEIVRAEADLEGLERELSRRSRRFARGTDSATLSPEQIAKSLPPRSALLDVIEVRRFRFDDAGELVKDFRYVAFLIRSDRPPIRIDFATPARDVNSAILRFRTEIETHRDTTQTGHALGQMIRQPLVPYLEGIDLLIVAGDDLLHYLPFAALPGSKAGSFWIEELAIATEPSAHALFDRRTRSEVFAEGALIVGGVDYIKLERLEGTVEEAEQIKRIYGKTHPGRPLAEIVTGAEATPDRLREMLPKQRFAHMATHGFFQAAKGDALFKTHGASAQFDSGLVLAGKDHDDLLTAEEIGALDLRGTELFVLSACESGLGHLRAGQGVIGLVGALDRAGARSVISTLWKVSDEATSPFMSSFYRRFWGGTGPDRIGPAQALRQAQLDLIHGKIQSKTGKSYTHPFYWAAFVLVGATASPARP